MTKTKAAGRLDEAILETADDMHRLGIMDGATHEKITLRHLGDKVEAATRYSCCWMSSGRRGLRRFSEERHNPGVIHGGNRDGEEQGGDEDGGA